MRLALHVIGMFVFGTAALLGAGWLYTARVATPAPARAALDAVPIGSTGRAGPDDGATLFRATIVGIRGNLEIFVREVRANRREALRALDAAYHLSTVLGDTPGAAMPAFAADVRAVRRHVQNGRINDAIGKALEAAALSPHAAAPRTVSSLRDYVGATVLTPDGSTVGRVDGVDAGTLRLVIGPAKLLGFVPAGPAEVVRVVPADALFGPPSRVAATMIVVRNVER